MFKNVLVGIDGSDNGRDAVALAARLADPAAKLTLVHVRPGELHPLHAVTPGLLAEEREASEKLLARACTARLKRRAPTCSSLAPARAACSGAR